MKGVSPLGVLALLIVGLLAIAALAAYVQLAVPVAPAVEYEGEFDDVYLATKGPFYSDFSEQVDANISNDVLTATYRTLVALNATANPAVNSRDYVLALAIDIDGAVKNMEISGKLGNGVASTGDPANDFVIKSVQLWTHEDNPTLKADLTKYIEDQIEIDAETGPLEKDTYVLEIVFHSKVISPDFTTGDDLMQLELELDTDGDVDTAQITIESA